MLMREPKLKFTRDSGGANLFDHRKPVHFRQHDIHHREVEFLDFGAEQPFRAVGGVNGAVACLLQSFEDERGGQGIVFNK